MNSFRPTNQLLALSRMDLSVWLEAERQAKRAAMPKFCVGAVCVKDGRVIGRGCAHPAVGVTDTTHAEVAAIRSLPRDMVAGSELVIVALGTKHASWSYSARPCARCAAYIHGRGVQSIHYASRDTDGLWSLRTEAVSDLAECAQDIPLHEYATRMKIMTPVKARELICNH